MMILSDLTTALEMGFKSGVHARTALHPDDLPVALYYAPDHIKRHEELMLAFEAGYNGAISLEVLIHEF
jgi:hypothetical protein